ncbi:diguanylate cyclase [Ralstonia sp. 24A2]|uniref:GGDEF domain-containing protein n=1 Tax=Ralstonia sp. 24A2 TaxID=3447364 RepID=UPI003F69919F
MTENNPSETARHALKLLASRRLAPTPDNFAAIYYELAGSKPNGDAQSAERVSLVRELCEQLARTVEYCLPALGEDDVAIGPVAWALVRACRSESENLTHLNAKLAAFNHRLSLAAEDQNEIRKSLMGLLQLVFENIGQLSLDDRWLRGQIDALLKASEAPVSLRRLDDVRRRLKEVIQKQGTLKAKSVEAQEEMKRLLASFMERLSNAAETSGEHHRQMEACAKKIESAKTISEIAPAIQDALSATRWMSLQAAHNRDALSAMKKKAEDAATEVANLRKALDMASASARHDLLTGALNRKGLEEALEREVARAAHQNSTLSIAFLDIDDFKSINDAHGHSFGDDALSHLAQVARESIRPQDALARFGGEEFVILMPDTCLEEGVQAITRLQRTLTQRFFAAGDTRLFITFSAGVAELGKDEAPMAAIQRADRGMYQAKRAGKNKVVSA